jgi:hypothetical protein
MLRVEAFEFDASVVGCEAPISDGVMGVSAVDPGGDLVGDCRLVGDAAVETLRGQDAEFGFSQVEPGAVFGRVILFTATCRVRSRSC